MLFNHKPLSSLTAAELAVTKANCPALVHAFNWDGLAVGASTILTDLVGDVELSVGISEVDPVLHSATVGASTLDEALNAGSWVNPGAKTCVIISMHGGAGASTALFIMGWSASGPSGDGLRTNRNIINAYDHSAVVTGAAVAPASTDSGAMVALRLTPGASINSIIVDDSQALVNAESAATIPATIDALGDVFGISTAPYWGELVLHFDNPPTDQAIAEAMAFIRPHWSRGEFVIAPNMLGWT